MSNFYTHQSYNVYYNTWYIDRTGDIHIDDVTNNDILYEVLQSYSDDEIDIHTDTINNGSITIYDYISQHPKNNIQFIFEDCHITEDDQNCPICMETKQPTHICRLNCKHSFCHHCIIQYMERNQQYSTCPLCRDVITSLHIHTHT